jgi:type II secretory pathway pseudopilin PulG
MPAVSPRAAAFSLVEVVVAIGIFAIAIVSVIGLLVPIRNSVAEVASSDDASRLAAVIQSQVQALGFSALARTDATPAGQDFLNSPPADGIYASRDGTKVGRGNDTTKWGSPVSNAEKYFKVELIRNTTLSPDTAANDTSAGSLAFTIKLTWPAFVGDTAASPSSQNSLLLPAAITR